MARAKPAWRRLLTARHLRWRLAVLAVRLMPWLAPRLGFFPDGADMIAAADEVLADERGRVDPAMLRADRAFLERCLVHDSAEPGLSLTDGVETGRRTVLFRRAWIDMASGDVLLPARRATVILRGRGGQNVGAARPGRQRIALPGRAFVPLDTVHYFHLLLENGVRILDLVRSGALGETPLTIVKPPDRTAVERALFAGIAARHPQIALRHLPATALAMPDEVICHFPRGPNREWPPIDRALAGDLAAAFAAVYGPPPPVTETRLYLSRGGAKLRRLRNGAALDTLLGAQGFAAFAATDANHAEQIARFAAADTVVAVHGAGLTNLLFCREGTRVVEIFPENFVKSTFWWLSRRLGLDYRHVVGGPGDYDQHFTLDGRALDAVRAAID